MANPTMETPHNDVVTIDAPHETDALIGRYDRYADAQRVVDALSDDGFPVHRLRIVASGLTFVEQVTGRRTVLRAAGQGLGTGALFGFLIGAVLGSFTFLDPFATMIVTGAWGLLIGAVLGAGFGAIGHALTGGRRDFDAVGSFSASAYEVRADAEVAAEARRRLSPATG